MTEDEPEKIGIEMEVGPPTSVVYPVLIMVALVMVVLGFLDPPRWFGLVVIAVIIALQVTYVHLVTRDINRFLRFVNSDRHHTLDDE